MDSSTPSPPCSRDYNYYFLGSYRDTDNNDAGSELELGLSLGGGGGGGSGGVKFLTAKYFPSVRRRPVVVGTKRAADSVCEQGGSLVHHGSSSSASSTSQVVGWPPVRTYRINNLAASQSKPINAEERRKTFGGCELSENSTELMMKKNMDNATEAPAQENSRLGFVKVNMDGVQIGRKVDLNAHSCYETLAQVIQDMFFKPTTSINSICDEKEWLGKKASKLLDGSSEFVLTYEDKDGDWMLVGDVPWRMFVNNVRRLRIMRTSEANGLGNN